MPQPAAKGSVRVVETVPDWDPSVTSSTHQMESLYSRACELPSLGGSSCSVKAEREQCIPVQPTAETEGERACVDISCPLHTVLAHYSYYIDGEAVVL